MYLHDDFDALLWNTYIKSLLHQAAKKYHVMLEQKKGED